MDSRKHKFDHIRSRLVLDLPDRELDSMVEYYLDAVEGSSPDYDSDIEKLNSGIPVQYVCKRSFFYGYRFYVDPNVLIPRPETEELVYWVEQEYKGYRSLKLLDIGSGSGCIVISLARILDLSTAMACDISQDALDIVSRNARMNGVEVKCINWDVLNEDPPAEFADTDIVCCNPPYILHTEKERMDSSVLGYEPELALFVEGQDPLLFYKRLIGLFLEFFSDKTVLYFETSDLYKEELEEYLRTKALKYEFRRDLQMKWRMLKLWK